MWHNDNLALSIDMHGRVVYTVVRNFMVELYRGKEFLQFGFWEILLSVHLLLGNHHSINLLLWAFKLESTIINVQVSLFFEVVDCSCIIIHLT